MFRSFQTFRRFQSTATSGSANFKKWRELSTNDKKQFINKYVAYYKSKNSCTKNYFKQLSSGMDEYDDIPAVFGILYNDLIDKQRNNITSAEFDAGFFDLLYKK